MKRFIQDSLVIFLIGFVMNAFLPVTKSRADDNKAMLVTYIHGINSDGNRLKANVNAMFHINKNTYKFFHIRVKYNGVVYKNVEYNTNNPHSLNQLKNQIANDMQNNGNIAVNVDMDLKGVRTVVTNALSLGALDLTGRVVSHFAKKSITAWDAETKSAAEVTTILNETFKEQHPGRSGMTVLVGHSAGTEVVNNVPMDTVTAGGGSIENLPVRSLVDLRILSSSMNGTMKDLSPSAVKRTVFIIQPHDFTAAHNGDVYAPENFGDLAKQGTIITLKNYPLEANILSVEKNHSETQDFHQFRDMTVETRSGKVTFHGRMEDIIAKHILPEIQNGQDPQQVLVETITAEKPKATPGLGGISLSQTAIMPAYFSDNTADHLSFDPARKNALSIVMKNGDRIFLPSLDDIPNGSAIEAEMAYCTFTGILPETSLLYVTDNNKHIWIFPPPLAGKKKYCRAALMTSLGDFLLRTDDKLGSVVLGFSDHYVPPPGIPGYHPYEDLSQDFLCSKDNSHNNDCYTRYSYRVWTAPSIVRMGLETDDGSNLYAKDVQMFIHLDSWIGEEFPLGLGSRGVFIYDPGAAFLSAQLTANYNKLGDSFALLKRLAAIEGVLIWAKNNKVFFDPDSLKSIIDTAKADRSAMLSSTDAFLQKRFLSFGSHEENGFFADGGKPRKPDMEPYPIPLFNKFGLSRIVWGTDGNALEQSQIVYDDQGYIQKLIGRHGHTVVFSYDSNGLLSLISPENGFGIAIKKVKIGRTKGFMLVNGVKIDKGTGRAEATYRSRATPIFDINGFMHRKIEAWTKYQYLGGSRNGGNTDTWLVGKLQNRFFVNGPILILSSIFLIGLVPLFLLRKPIIKVLLDFSPSKPPNSSIPPIENSRWWRTKNSSNLGSPTSKPHDTETPQKNPGQWWRTKNSSNLGSPTSKPHDTETPQKNPGQWWRTKNSSNLGSPTSKPHDTETPQKNPGQWWKNKP